MAEQMDEMQLLIQERRNTGSSWTHNEQFDKDGYLVVKNLWDVEELYHPLPELRGQLNYWDNNVENFNHHCSRRSSRRITCTILASTISSNS